MSDHAAPALTPGRHGALVGTTASGKSAIGLALAQADGHTEIVSADSMQVYRGMDIGTAKPTPGERAAVPHHGLDIAEPWQEVTLTDFQAHAQEAITAIEGRGHRALLVGGTGLYVRAVVDDLRPPGRFPDVRAALERDPDTQALHRRLAELDPVAADRMEPTNRRRVVRALEVTLGSRQPFSSFGPGLATYATTPFRLVGLDLPIEVIDHRIETRYHDQIAEGFLEEARRLLADPAGVSRTAGQALGYAELFAHLAGECSLDEALDLAIRRTRRFARRQRSWFRRDPRIVWVRGDDPTEMLGDVRAALGWDSPS